MSEHPIYGADAASQESSGFGGFLNDVTDTISDGFDWLTDLAYKRNQLDVARGRIVENEAEPMYYRQAGVTNSPAEAATTTVPTQPTGEPVGAAQPFYKDTKWLYIIIAVVVVLLILAVLL